MISLKVGAIIVAAFISGAFISSPELRAYAVHKITSEDIVDNTIQSADIKDGQVTAADIATNAVRSAEIAPDSVGASELSGVSKLIFAECTINVPAVGLAPLAASCDVPGAMDVDNAFVTIRQPRPCLDITDSDGGPDSQVSFTIANRCSFPTTSESLTFWIIAFHP